MRFLGFSLDFETTAFLTVVVIGDTMGGMILQIHNFVQTSLFEPLSGSYLWEKWELVTVAAAE